MSIFKKEEFKQEIRDKISTLMPYEKKDYLDAFMEVMDCCNLLDGSNMVYCAKVEDLESEIEELNDYINLLKSFE